MTRQKIEKITLNKAIRAFDYAVCNDTCKGNAAKAAKCLTDRSECTIRKNFIKKLS